jgi:hypothetical protein
LKQQSVRAKHVQYIPKVLEEGVLYISKEFATASHLCCCGCGTKIVTPLMRPEYTLTERGGRVSLSPSIGNWNHPCQSHYWIRDDRVEWAERMSKDAIQRGREHDDAQTGAYYRSKVVPWWRRALNAIAVVLTALSAVVKKR